MNKRIFSAIVASAFWLFGYLMSGLAQAVPVGPDVSLSPMSQENAVRTAEEYLDVSSFSRQGLIQQLQYDGYSIEDATYAVDNITVDWNEQAAKAAKNYLDISGFSQSGLVEQLEYDGFTPSQASYGVNAAGF